jgi:hypothetical protein
MDKRTAIVYRSILQVIIVGVYLIDAGISKISGTCAQLEKKIIKKDVQDLVVLTPP